MLADAFFIWRCCRVAGIVFTVLSVQPSAFTAICFGRTVDTFKHDKLLPDHLSIIIKDTSMLMWITICELAYQCNQVNIYSFNPVTSYLVGAGIYLILFLIVQGIRRIVRAKNNARSTSDRTEISDEGKEACAV